MTSELLTTAEAAVLLKKNIRTIARWAERGDLPYVRKLSGKNGYLFDSAVVELYARVPQRRKATAS